MKRHRRPSTRRPLPRCRCGKAIYPTREAAERDRRKRGLEASHLCRFGNHHITSQGQRSPRPRRSLPMLTTCPVCGEVAEDGDPASLVDELASCAHPVHWPDRDPEAPYFPDVAVQLTGETGNVFIALGLVRRALVRADLGKEIAAAYATDFTSSPDYSAALACAQRWVTVS